MNIPLSMLGMYKKDLLALTLLGPTWENPVLEPLSVQYLNNWQYIVIC